MPKHDGHDVWIILRLWFSEETVGINRGFFFYSVIIFPGFSSRSQVCRSQSRLAVTREEEKEREIYILLLELSMRGFVEICRQSFESIFHVYICLRYSLKFSLTFDSVIADYSYRLAVARRD